MRAAAGLLGAMFCVAACAQILGDDFYLTTDADKSSASATSTSSASGGAGGLGSGGAGGAGGSGGSSCANAFPGNGSECDDCMTRNCCSKMSACANSATCYACVTTRTEAACANVGQEFYDFNQCWAEHCSSPISMCAAKPACDAPPTAPSGGTCFQMTANDDCNPITNSGCMPTEYCTFSSEGSYCRLQNQNQAACEPCDNPTPIECGPGLQCTFANQCGRWCCNDQDCGSGTCIYSQLVDIHPELGTCYQEGSFFF
jgi:hypothetical protein